MSFKIALKRANLFFINKKLASRFSEICKILLLHCGCVGSIFFFNFKYLIAVSQLDTWNVSVFWHAHSVSYAASFPQCTVIIVSQATCSDLPLGSKGAVYVNTTRKMNCPGTNPTGLLKAQFKGPLLGGGGGGVL